MVILHDIITSFFTSLPKKYFPASYRMSYIICQHNPFKYSQEPYYQNMECKDAPAQYASASC